jgi:hypothetical protein
MTKPVDVYVCVAVVALPARLLGVDPSPQFTEIEVTVPSGSVAEKVTVTSWPVVVELGETFEKVTAGGRSLTVSIVVPEPGPALLVAVTVMVKTCDFVAPVLV